MANVQRMFLCTPCIYNRAVSVYRILSSAPPFPSHHTSTIAATPTAGTRQCTVHKPEPSLRAKLGRARTAARGSHDAHEASSHSPFTRWPTWTPFEHRRDRARPAEGRALLSPLGRRRLMRLAQGCAGRRRRSRQRAPDRSAWRTLQVRPRRPRPWQAGLAAELRRARRGLRRFAGSARATSRPLSRAPLPQALRAIQRGSSADPPRRRYRRHRSSRRPSCTGPWRRRHGTASPSAAHRAPHRAPRPAKCRRRRRRRRHLWARHFSRSVKQQSWRRAVWAVVAVVAVVAAVVVRLHGGASAEPSRTRRLAASPILSRSLSGCVA